MKTVSLVVVNLIGLYVLVFACAASAQAQAGQLSESELLAIVNGDPPVYPAGVKGMKQKGLDGVEVFVPTGWTTAVGVDKRLVAIPPGGVAGTGADKRMIAIPKGWVSGSGADGRLVAIPPGGLGGLGSVGADK
ncbi:MAG TPA: hypothetical protein VEL76_04430 [Gemmataceae bacterium]|nr:hypothetical protein [Gemmataceae bacterium]